VSSFPPHCHLACLSYTRNNATCPFSDSQRERGPRGPEVLHARVIDHRLAQPKSSAHKIPEFPTSAMIASSLLIIMGKPVSLHLVVQCMVFIIVLLLSRKAEATPQSNIFIAAPAAKLCLTVGSDSATLQVFACAVNLPSQIFEYAPSAGTIKVQGKCVDALASSNGNALQTQPCVSQSLQQSWTFGQDGLIRSRMQPESCVGRTGDLASASMLFLGSCATSISWAISLGVPFQAVAPPPPPLFQSKPVESPPQLPGASSSPQLPSISPQQQQPPQLQQTQPIAPPPLLYGGGAFGQTQPAYSNVATEAGKPTSADHFLCVCVVDKDAGACNQAARTACQIGHLPAASCAQSFGQGKHDSITTDILKIIENGARCSAFDPAVLKNEAAQIGGRGASDGTPTADDHYLCVCLEEGGVNIKQKCESAVRSACLVGHIPSGDCEASLSKVRFSTKATATTRELLLFCAQVLTFSTKKRI